jgi:hypothetical protein
LPDFVALSRLVVTDLSARPRRVRVRHLLCAVCHSSPTAQVDGCALFLRSFESDRLETTLRCVFPDTLLSDGVPVGLDSRIKAPCPEGTPTADLPESSISWQKTGRVCRACSIVASSFRLLGQALLYAVYWPLHSTQNGAGLGSVSFTMHSLVLCFPAQYPHLGTALRSDVTVFVAL